MAAIAAEAGVAVQTLYLGFGSKLGILSAALDVAIVGDDEPVPLLERPWMRALVDTPDGHQAIQVLVEQVGEIIGRTSPLYAVMQGAAAGEAGELLAENKRQRFNGVHAVATCLSTKPGFAAAMTVDHATDLLYALLSEEQYGLLVVERGWAPEAWRRWCISVLDGTLFPEA
jgi:AcrR family transcriptional regulator